MYSSLTWPSKSKPVRDAGYNRHTPLQRDAKDHRDTVYCRAFNTLVVLDNANQSWSGEPAINQEQARSVVLSWKWERPEPRWKVSTFEQDPLKRSRSGQEWRRHVGLRPERVLGERSILIGAAQFGECSKASIWRMFKGMGLVQMRDLSHAFLSHTWVHKACWDFYAPVAVPSAPVSAR